MASSTYDILVDIRTRVDSLAQTVAEVRGLKGAVDDAGRSARTTTESFVGLAKGQAIQIATDLARQLVTALSNAVREGVRFNATIETATIGIAGLLRNADPAKFGSFTQAVAVSTRVIEQLKEAAKESPASLADLTEAFQSTAGAALAAGIPIERQVGLVVRLSQVLGALGIPNFQIPQELRALLTGDIDLNARAANTLGITGDDVRRERSRGNLEQFLLQRTSGFGEASTAASQSFDVIASNFGDALQQLKGVATSGLTTELKKVLGDAIEVLGKPETLQQIRALSIQIGGVAAGLLKVADYAARASRFLNSLSLPGRLVGAIGGGAAANEAAKELAITERLLTLQQQIAGAKTQAEFDKATTEIRTALDPRVNRAGFDYNSGEAALLNALLNSYRSLADVQKKRAAEEARSAQAASTAVEKAKELLKTSTDAAEREQAYNTIISARDTELSRGVNANKERLAALTKIVAEEDKARAAARGTSGALQGVIADSETIKRNFERIPSILADMTEKLRQTGVQLRIIQAEGNASKIFEIRREELNRSFGEVQRTFGRQGVKVSTLPPTNSDVEAPLPGRGGENELKRLQEALEAYKQEYENLRAKIAANPLFGGNDERTNKALIDESKAAFERAQEELSAFASAGLGLEDQKRKQETARLETLREEAKARRDLNEVNRLSILIDRQKEDEKARGLGVANPSQVGARAARATQAAAATESRLTVEDLRLQQQLADIEQRRQSVQNNTLLTANEKEARNRNLLREEIELLKQLIAFQQQRLSELEKGGPEEQKAAQAAVGRIQELGRQQKALEAELGRSSLTGQITSGLNTFLNNFGSTAQQVSGIVTGTLGAAISGINNSITGLINGTITWGQAFKQVGASILTTLIQLVIQLLLVKAIEATLGIIGLLTGPGLLVGLASGGPVRAANGMFVSQGTTDTADDVPALLSKGEYVIRAAAVRRYGQGFFDRLNGMSTPVSEFASGGLAKAAGLVQAAFGGGGTGASSLSVKVVPVASYKAAFQELMKDPETQTHILDVSLKNQVQLGIVG